VTPTPKDAAAIVLGGGIAGLQAAIDLARLGIRVHLVERGPSIGGRMAQLDKTFPTNDCSMCILAPKMIECAGHPNVTLHTLAELVRLEGGPGAFRAVIRKRSRFVDDARCTGCGDCAAACPVRLPNEFELGLGERASIHKPFPQAVPNVFSITKSGHAPCRDRCPAGVNAQGYVQLLRQGSYDRALAVVHETMPFAGTIGRICPRPCEGACTRGEVDEPVSICSLKRAAADLGAHVPEVAVDAETRRSLENLRVAVVGAGPAGLTAAYNLARRGYPVTVFERLPVAGGMLRVGVPAYRLPRDVLEREIDLVRGLGVEIRTGVAIEGAAGARRLLAEGFAAVFLATGAHASTRLAIPGEDLAGVIGAVDLLRAVALGQPVTVGRSAVVVGGGNAAIDAARTLLRLGAAEVSLLYRRTRDGMPALGWEIDAALAEGVRLSTLAAPAAIDGAEGRVTGLRAIRMRLGAPDDTGRPRPEPLPGSGHLIPCEMVVPAIGQAPDLDFAGSGIGISNRGTIIADPATGATGLSGVFAGGDAVSGPATAIEAVAAGNRAADAIHARLSGEAAGARVAGAVGSGRPPVSRPGAGVIARAVPAARVRAGELPAGERFPGFAEVETGLDAGQVAAEAARCLNCATCCECRECARVCKAGAVDHLRGDEVLRIEVGACVVATGFDMFDASVIEEYGSGRIADVVTGLEFERLLSASGPTGGHVRRPSDGVAPRRIAFIQCVGSRDVRNRVYCSAVCCMHATKEAILAHEHDPAVESTIFYMDLRAAGKTFQEYVSRAREEYAVRYVRARPAGIERDEETGEVKVIHENTTTRELHADPFDLAVLCQALVPSAGAAELAAVLGVELDEHGFIRIPDPLRAPVDTTVPGVLAAGYATGPQDIPDSVVQASAAAGRAAELLFARRARHG
jgi:heterodisulfide reductase subunit A-like polyferredoxin